MRARILSTAVSMLGAAAIWVPLMHFWFRPRLEAYYQPVSLAPQARQLAERHLRLWEDPVRRAGEVDRMRCRNAEWDFMGRTFLVLGLANMALREPAAERRYLEVIDAIIDETLRLEAEHGMHFFLMDYALGGRFVAQPARSTFLDGEIAMMLAARQFVRPDARFAQCLATRVDILLDYMSRSPLLCGESYPNECWLFCNSAAIAAIRLSDCLDGRDHSEFIQRWLATARESLIDADSGLLTSSFTYNGDPIDGPEGSSLWMTTHCLQLVDPKFAEQQYALARRHLARHVFGFGYAREWPESSAGQADVDSGPIVPLLGASAGSSGLAVLGAASSGDAIFLGQLLASLEYAAFPIRKDGELRFAASNQVGDAVLLYAMVQGPLWQKAGKQP